MGVCGNRGRGVLDRQPSHLASNGHPSHPSDGPLLEAFQPCLFAFHTRHSGSVAFNAPAAACIAGSRHYSLIR